MKKIYLTIFLFYSLIGLSKAEIIDAVYYNPSLTGDYKALKVTDTLKVKKNTTVGTSSTSSAGTTVFTGKAQTTATRANTYTIDGSAKATNVDMPSTRFVVKQNTPLEIYASSSDQTVAFKDSTKTSDINNIKGIENGSIQVKIFANQLVQTGDNRIVTVGKIKSGLTTYDGEEKTTANPLSKNSHSVMLKLGKVPIRSIHEADVCEGSAGNSSESVTLKWYRRLDKNNDMYRVLGCDAKASTPTHTPTYHWKTTYYRDNGQCYVTQPDSCYCSDGDCYGSCNASRLGVVCHYYTCNGIDEEDEQTCVYE